jgi:hypothetical protein
MIEHVGFGVNGFSMRDPFDPLIDSVGLEAAVQAYERRWGPSSDGGRAQVEYIIRAYLSASARLIAAAPDMLAALREVSERAQPEGPLPPFPDRYELMVRRVRAAIAKAEGRL